MLKRCRGCSQFFKSVERVCPHCGAAVPIVTASRSTVALAVAAATMVASNCGQFYARPLYGVVVFDAGTDGGP